MRKREKWARVEWKMRRRERLRELKKVENIEREIETERKKE